MWKDAGMLALCCVLFVQMGLSGAIQETLGIQSRVLSCPKCLTFWSTFVLQIFGGQAFLPALAVSFLFSYLSLWVALLYDWLATLYNKTYESITSSATSHFPANATADNGSASSRSADGVPEVRKSKKVKV